MIFRSIDIPALSRRIGIAIIPALLFGFCLTSEPAEAAIGPLNQSGQNGPPTTRGDITVTDITGRPLSGVAVMIQPRPMPLLPENISETTATVTNQAGKFQQPEKAVGGTYWVLRKPGFEALALDASRGVRSNITLRPGRTITGKVFDLNGQPISGALVGPVAQPPQNPCRDHWEHRGPMPRQMTRTAADGSYKLTGIPLEPVAVQITAPGYTPRLVVFAANETGTKIALSQGGAIISGTVVGSKDRAPKASVLIEATGNNLILQTTTNQQGTYTFDSLPTGTWKLRPAGGGPLSGTQSRAKIIEIARKNQVIDLPLVLNQGIILAGQAIDAKTSQGLPGINITLSGYAGHGAKAVLTDPNGYFAFENLDSMHDAIIRFDPLKFVYLLPGGAYRDYFDISKVGDTNFDVTTMTIPLHRRLEVKGKVRDASGKLTPDVEIRIQSLNVITSTPSKSGPGALTFTTYTNEAGEFVAGVYPPGQYKVWAQQDAFVSQVENIDVYTTSPAPTVNLRLDRAAQLEGLLTNADDAPVTAAIVIAWPADSPEPQENPIPGREDYQFSKTDSKGHFLLQGLRGEPLILRATHPAYVQSVELPVNPALIQTGTSNSVILKFPAGGEFSATVTNDKGEPLSGAEVQIDYSVGLDGRRTSVKTDVYGQAFIGAIPAKKINKLVVFHPIYAPFETESPLNLPQKNFKVSLKKRGSLIAHVDGESPYPGVPVEIFLLHAPAGPNDSKEPPEQGFEQTSRITVVAGQAVFPNLPPGWYKAAYADSGAYAESEAVHMEAGSGDHEVELTLPKGNHLLGMVTDKQTGEGITGAKITLRPTVQSQIVTERATQHSTTVEGGAFEMFNVGAGQLHLKVIAAGYPDYEREQTFEPGQTLDIEMSNVPASLTGRVSVGDAPVEGALLVLTKSSGDHQPVGTAITDESGTYNIDDFPAGSYTLAVEAPIGEGENISRKSVALQVDGKDTTQNIEFAALVAVHGKVRLDGKAAIRESGGATTILFRGIGDGAESKMVQIKEDSTYSTQLEPGTYTVSLEDREGRELEVPAGDSAQINLDF